MFHSMLTQIFMQEMDRQDPLIDEIDTKVGARGSLSGALIFLNLMPSESLS